MLNNRRPSGWLYNGDPDYEGTTVAQRRAIQNQLDLLEAQQLSNELVEQKMKEDKDNANLIANATINASKLKSENDLKLHQIKNNDDEYKRKLTLCDNLGLDYTEINNLINNILEPDSTKMKKLNDLNLELTELKNKYSNTVKSKTSYVDFKINEVQNKLQGLRSQYAALSPSSIGNDNFASRILLNSIFVLIILLTTVLSFEAKEILICIIPILIAIVYNFYYHIQHKKQYKLNKSNLKNKIDKLSKELQNLNDDKLKIISQIPNENVDTSAEQEQLNVKINKLKDDISSEIYDKVLKFDNFRYQHYNEEIETLFKQLKLTVTKLDYTKIKEYGTIKDYMYFLRTL